MGPCHHGTASLPGYRQHRGCFIPQAVTHSLVLLKMGGIIVRNTLSWLELLINRYCCILLVVHIIISAINFFISTYRPIDGGKLHAIRNNFTSCKFHGILSFKITSTPWFRSLNEIVDGTIMPNSLIELRPLNAWLLIMVIIWFLFDRASLIQII